MQTGSRSMQSKSKNFNKSSTWTANLLERKSNSCIKTWRKSRMIFRRSMTNTDCSLSTKFKWHMQSSAGRRKCTTSFSKSLKQSKSSWRCPSSETRCPRLTLRALISTCLRSSWVKFTKTRWSACMTKLDALKVSLMTKNWQYWQPKRRIPRRGLDWKPLQLKRPHQTSKSATHMLPKTSDSPKLQALSARVRKILWLSLSTVKLWCLTRRPKS